MLNNTYVDNHEMFHPKFSAMYNSNDILNIFETDFKKFNINTTLLDNYINIFNDFNNCKIDNHKHFDKLKRIILNKNNVPSNIRKSDIYQYYLYLLRKKKIIQNNNLEYYIKIKSARSISGIVSVTIFTAGDLFNKDGTKTELIKGGGCPMDCHYCPNEKKNNISTQPRSYLSDEPGNLRATRNKHHPVGQTYDRLRTLEKIGHISTEPDKSSKIDFIISGATFNFYPKDYITWFVRCMYFACNTYYIWDEYRPMLSMSEEQKINESASIRVIGLTIETRPDYLTPKKKKTNSINFSELEFLRYLGVTRIQIGIQSTKDDILKKINRKCTNYDNKIGIRRCLQNGWKLDLHIMFDLPGSSPEIDKEVIDEIISDDNYQADQWKLYPTETTPYTKIKEWYDKGLYKPYAEDHEKGVSYKLVDVISYTFSKIPEYIRVNRVVRDIPTKCIDGGLKVTNLRQVISDKMKKNGIITNDIRERECRNKSIDYNDLSLNVLKYPSSSGINYFINYTNKDKRILYGFIRLRINKELSDVMECLRGCALIRELHIYGPHVNIGDNMSKTSIQHHGLGSKLLKKAELIAYQNNIKKIAVISGAGVRDYYRNKGYELGELNYMYKELTYKLRLGIIILQIILLVNFICNIKF